MRVTLFVTCLTDTVAPEAGIAVVRILERVGHEVEFPSAQTRCGQMHLNTGYRTEGRLLARRFLRVFADAELVVAPSASCVGTVRELYPTLADGDEAMAREIEALVPRIFELSELLAGRFGLEDVGGTFPVKNADTSAAILADKVRCVLDTGADVCTASDSSCLLQIGGALSRLGTRVRTAHLAEILAARGRRRGGGF